MGKRRTKTIQWSPEAARARDTVKPYRPYVGATVGLDKSCAQHLVIGSLWRTSFPLVPEQKMGRFKQHPYDYLHSWYPDGQHIPAGTVAVFAGNVRVEEQNRTLLVTVNRPSFIVHGMRYITSNLTHYEPVCVEDEIHSAV